MEIGQNEPNPLTFGTRPRFRWYLWAIVVVNLVLAVGLLLRAMEWIFLVPIAEDPTVLAFLLSPLLFLALAAWMGRWALYHGTVQVSVTDDGLTMKSAAANDTIRWDDIDEIRLQGLSGSEVRLSGKGHRVTAPSGSAATVVDTKHLEAWIEYRLGDKELKYEGIHFWGP